MLDSLYCRMDGNFQHLLNEVEKQQFNEVGYVRLQILNLSILVSNKNYLQIGTYKHANSISRFQFGTNLFSFSNINQLESTLQSIADNIGITNDELMKGTVKRFDIAVNIGIPIKVCEFNSYLERMPKRKKCMENDNETVYFGKGTNKETCVYDKVQQLQKEKRKARQTNDENYLDILTKTLKKLDGKNIVRFEFRFRADGITNTFGNMIVSDFLSRTVWERIQTEIINTISKIEYDFVYDDDIANVKALINELSANELIETSTKDKSKLQALKRKIATEKDSNKKRALRKKLNELSGTANSKFKPNPYKEFVERKVKQEFDKFLGAGK